MVVGQAFPQVERHAQRVAKATAEQQPESAGRNVFHQWLEGNDADPAHANVQQGSQFAVVHAAQFKGDSDQRQCPDQQEQRPSPRPTQADQRERRVGSGNQQEDGGVVDAFYGKAWLNTFDCSVEAFHLQSMCQWKVELPSKHRLT